MMPFATLGGVSPTSQYFQKRFFDKLLYFFQLLGPVLQFLVVYFILLINHKMQYKHRRNGCFNYFMNKMILISSSALGDNSG